MALNLSTLTSPATSGDVLAEALTTADFLEPCPVLRNLSRGSNKGGDAKQDVALNQPKALPLIKNPQGNLGGYLYIPNVAGNYATGPSVTIGSNETWEGEVDVIITQFGNYFMPMGGGDWYAGFGLLMYSGGNIRVFSKGIVSPSNPSGITLGTPLNIKYGFGSTGLYVKINDVIVSQATASQASSITHPLELNQQAALTNVGNYAIQKAKLTVNNAVVFDCDFNGSTSIRHGDTKWQAAVGGPVTINQSGNDPATIIKKPVLRFDGANSSFQGLFGQTFTEGYMFAAFSVLGDGGESLARIFSANSTGAFDYQTGGFAIRRYNVTDQIQVRWNGGSEVTHSDVFNGERGDFLLESPLRAGDQNSKINNADADDGACVLSNPVSSEEFGIGSNTAGNSNACLDLEYLALFPATITDAQAEDVRNYINNRNNVFDLKDGFGYYFYDAQNAPVGNISSGSASWNGRIVGSDFGDTDKLATQGTSDDQPVGDGYVVNFADNTDHLEIPQVTLASGDSYAWMVCGTSLGTFAYKVTVSGQTELTLLGHLGNATYRQAGDLYGVILLPESATGADIEAARKLLIDRGAADGTTASDYFAAWVNRVDIVKFKNVDMTSATAVSSSWDGCSSLSSFDVSLPAVTNVRYTWFNCSSLSDFRTTDIRNGTNFTSAWQGCSALTSFPAGAKLGTEASNVNFDSAWRSSGLTSFPALDLSNATSLYSTWRDCDDMLSFSLVNTSSVTNFSDTWLGCNSLTSFPLIDTSSGTRFYRTWYDLDSITDFPLLNVSAGRYFSEGWRFCAELVNFPAGLFNSWNPASITSGVFDFAWTGCTSLTAQSVENILTSIDASGKYATSTGASGGSALGDAGIDIDYNGDTLSAATNAAVTSLKAKGWVIVVNGVTL